VATVLMIFLRILSKFHSLPSPLREVILQIHSLTFNDAQINFNDTQFVSY